MKIRVGIGQDSHAFSNDMTRGSLVLGGIVFEGYPRLEGNSDADVVLHSITNAISGVTCTNILGEIADKMCLEDGITDSSEYLRKALDCLEGQIVHLSVSIECQKPPVSPEIPRMRENLSRLLGIPQSSIGITATSGEGLTAFGRGEGIHVFSCVTVSFD